MLTYKDTLAQITNDWLQQFNIPDHINHLHIASFYLLESTQGDWVNFLGPCRARGISISLDTNWTPLENWSDVLPILSLIDVFIPNEQEAMLITNESVEELCRISELVRTRWSAPSRLLKLTWS